jgi:hypothetical protein
MPMYRHRTRALVWLPLLAVLALNLLGLASQAMVFSRLGTGPMMPCPMHAAMLLPGSADEAGEQPQAAGSASCPLMALAAVQAVPLPALVPAAPVLLHGHEQAALFFAAPHTLYAWSSPHSRGPPAQG